MTMTPVGYSLTLSLVSDACASDREGAFGLILPFPALGGSVFSEGKDTGSNLGASGGVLAVGSVGTSFVFFRSFPR